MGPRLIVLIHAPTWGATNPPAHRRTSKAGFNPRAHMGRDAVKQPHVKWRKSFNPRAHMGRDYRRMGARSQAYSFNPRAHMGRDGGLGIGGLVAISFNPRAHMGRDGKLSLFVRRPLVSIHAPTWGATAGLYRMAMVH